MSPNHSERRVWRVGLLVPSSNTVMENDLHRSLPKERFTVHTARMHLEEATPEAERRMVAEFAVPAAAQLKTLYPHLVVFGCTSAGAVGGEEAICHRLGTIVGSPCLGVVASVTEALRRRALRRIAVITPYIDSLNRAVRASLEEAGFEVQAIHGMGITENFRLAEPQPGEIVAFAREKLTGVPADGLFVSCTNFRALAAREDLERALSLPVVTSNLAVLEAIRQRLDGGPASQVG